MKLVTFSGYAGVGKDTAGKLAQEVFGGTIYAFKTKLVSLACRLNPTIKYLVDMYGWEKAKEFNGVREFVISLSEEAIKAEFGKDFWAKQLEPSLDFSTTCWITDVRFEEEALWSTSKGGFNIRITRKGVSPIHPSEDMKWEPDVTIENDGSILDLRRNVISVLSRAFGRVDLHC